VKTVRLSAEADDEVVDAAAWYHDQRPGLELEFLAELESALDVISRRPASFPKLMMPEIQGVRRALLPRFPFALIFAELETHIRVVAVAHTKRQPGYWVGRAVD
jgi:plasmid stabilization system protein ParE